MDPQVLLVTSNVEGNVHAWDLSTGTQLTTFKGNSSNVNSLSLLGRDYLIAAQSSRGAVHCWTWHKDQVHQRSFASEQLKAVAATPDGLYCAAGGASGTVYVWETSSGRLLRSWPAHYKAATVLAFNDSGSILVTGGEDTLVNCWLVAEVLDTSGGGGLGGSFGAASLRPLHSWSDHTLPITSLVVGAGDANAIVVSGSLDRTVRVRSLVQGHVLLAVPFPAAIHSVALDPGEHAVYAGSAVGAIYEVSLVGEDPGSRVSVGGGSAAEGAAEDAGVSGEDPSRWHALEGHSRAVTCMGLTGDAAYLVSGSEDQSVRVWDLRSRQQVKLLPNPAKGPLTSLLVINRPPFMQVGGSHTASTSSQGTSTKKGPKRLQPLAPFAKYANAPGALKPWEGGLVILDGSVSAADPGAELASRDADSAGAGPGVRGDGGEGRQGAAEGGGGGGGGEGAEGGGVAELRQENERLRQQLAKAVQASKQWGEVNCQLQQLCSKLMTEG